MANISIVDTGYIVPNNTGTQLSTSNRANSGGKIVLKNVSFTPNITATLDDTPVIGKNITAVNYGSVENIKFSLNGLLDLSNTTDQSYLYQLIRLCQTYGYKALFYDEDRSSDTLKNSQQVLRLLSNSHYDDKGDFTGDTTQGDLSFSLWINNVLTATKNLTNVYHLHVRFTSFNIGDVSSKSLKSFTLEGEVTI